MMALSCRGFFTAPVMTELACAIRAAPDWHLRGRAPGFAAVGFQLGRHGHTETTPARGSVTGLQYNAARTYTQGRRRT
jgi:hypothetical protein